MLVTSQKNPPRWVTQYPEAHSTLTHPEIPDTATPSIDVDRAAGAIRDLLEAVGEDPEREGLRATPERVARAYQELLAGYRTNPEQLINGALFPADRADLVVVRQIEYHSLCEHHLLPFHGYATVAYVPTDRIIGLSKIPRIVDMFARRLQIQERLTRQIAEFIDTVVQPAGVAVVLDGVHLCASMRGVRKHDARMTTRCMLGTFEHDSALRAEFLALAHPTA